MTIGEALKEEREKLGLSRYKFSKDVIDRRFYGKVENDESQIGSGALIKLLFKHHINIEEFWKKLRTDYADKEDLKLEILNKKIELAVRAKDLDKVKEISNQFYQLDHNGIDYLRSLVFISYFLGKKADRNLLNKIEHELDKHDDLFRDVQAIRLFSNSLPILNSEQIDYFMKLIIKKVKVRELTKIDKTRIAQLCNNYLKTCLEREFKFSNVEMVYEYLISLTEPEFLTYRILGMRDYYLLTGKDKEARKLTNVLSDFGYNF